MPATRRTRSMTSRVPFHMGYERYSENSGITTNYGMYAGYGLYKIMNDTIGAAPKRGQFSYNPMDSTMDIIGGTPVSYRLTLMSNGVSWYSDGNPMPSLRGALKLPTEDTCPALVDPNTISLLQSGAATSCWAQRGRGNVNNWENLFQLTKTLDELRHPFRNFALWSDKWVTAYEARARKVLGSRKTRVLTKRELFVLNPAGAWLQYRYGVRLLINDVNQVLKQLQDWSSQRQVYTARGSKSVVDSYRKDNGPFLLGPGYWASGYQIDEKVECRGTSHDEYSLSLAGALGLDGRQLLTVGWELVPYSFVVDWFANVGDFLNASVPTPELLHIGECLSTRRTTTIVSWAEPAGTNGNGYSNAGSRGTHSVTTIRYSRVNTLGSGPSLQLNADFGLLKPTRAMDAVALAGAALARAFGVSGRIHLLYKTL
ncbi:TPA_asm: maturation protein [ssRNA phage SRR6960551_12]|uniref:Maturation protein n=1 Tax=ssRNA phage SRR6960551_12 TaxID=2786550 RepID=A0A8S5L0B4_9VIRU|nr:maturation protein [ssRNA phage SRR6960551_12]DAD51016.1 TPA_asm: maturation protein [ssRNA phage SRR6960551_12]